MSSDSAAGSVGDSAFGSRSESDRSWRAVALETAKETLGVLERACWRALARPTASDVAMVVATLSIGVVVGSQLVGTELAALAIVAGLGAATGARLLASDRPIVRGFGGAVAVPVAILVASPLLVAGALVLTSSEVGLFAGLSVWALVVAALAAGLVSWDRLGDGGVRRGATGTTLAAVGVVGVLVLRLVPESGVREHAGTAATDLLGAAGTVVVAADGSWAVLTFAGLLFATAVATRLTLGYLPLERLVPPDGRRTFVDAVARTRWSCSMVTRIALAGGLAAVAAAPALESVDSVPITPAELRGTVPAPAGDALATLVTAPGLRVALVVLFGTLVSLAALEWCRRALGRSVARILARLLAPIAGGALVALVLARALSETALEADLAGLLEGTAPPSVVDLIGAFPPFALAAVLLVAVLGVLSALFWTVTILRVVRILPPRAIGAALAAGSIFLLAVGLAVVGQVETAVVTAAGSFVLWDIGEYADGVRRELGREAATLRAELVHVGGSLLTGAFVAGSVVALYRWITADVPVTDPAYAAIAVGSGLLALVLVTWALRG
ncbi:DUF7519 family protein [Natronolimnohabitans innermongolicus]|uniref:Uncharacterized protein n=1 Tax=Natronolimnohabitans innermongolicus JCM 12255 TaxID=1227499 RepID=L9WUX2_9EURY|nr:hypothetical protein [Natronolimnohabitans innermongolicus]ELY53255.1 hypothetical protein C493_14533 [Natronolimnohabitans innermongolicus JCM 12255]